MWLPRQERRCRRVLRNYWRRFLDWLGAPRLGDGDLQRFYDSLSFVRVNRDNYSKMDRYRDFRRVFNTTEGRKVLAQIIAHCEGPIVNRAEIQNHADLSFRAGQREPGQWIVHVLNAEPLEETKQ